ncbi:MAG: ribonuclease P protein component [Flavitalea sp.]
MDSKIFIKTPFTLGKNERLKSRKLIELLFKEGKSFAIFPVRVYQLETEELSVSLQAGFTASSRSFKKAVDRNRIKRVMREAYRLQKHPLNTLLEHKNKKLCLFFIYTGRELPDTAEIKEKINLILNRVMSTLDEATPSNS